MLKVLRKLWPSSPKENRPAGEPIPSQPLTLKPTSLNSLLVLTEIRGLCELLKLNETDLRTYKLYKLMEAGENVALHFDDVDAEEMWFLLHTPQSVVSVREKLWEMVQFHEVDIDSITTAMSQYSWEQLRNWVAAK